MKKFCRFILVIFSVLILILGVVINLLQIGWLDFGMAKDLVKTALTESPSSQVILVITEICMIFAIIGIFVDTTDKKEPKGGRDILMQNENGKLMISRDTIENLVTSVVKKFKGTVESKTRIQLDLENNVIVLVDLIVQNDIIIKDLTIDMQNKIKEEIKRASDLEVKQVNVRIKNIANKEEDDKVVGKE